MSGAYVYGGKPKERAYPAPSSFYGGLPGTPEGTYELLIPFTNLGTLPIESMINNQVDLLETLRPLLEKYFPQSDWSISYAILTIYNEGNVKGELNIISVLRPWIIGPSIKETVNGLISDLKQEYKVNISSIDHAGIPSPWVWVHSYGGVVGAPRLRDYSSILIFWIGVGLNLMLKNYLRQSIAVR